MNKKDIEANTSALSCARYSKIDIAIQQKITGLIFRHIMTLDANNNYIKAINRFKKVVNDYDTTIYVEEALHRLVELHYKIGLVNEAEKYALLLGYNYQSSQWYEASYKVFNRDYKKRSLKDKRKSENLLKKFKKIFK